MRLASLNTQVSQENALTASAAKHAVRFFGSIFLNRVRRLPVDDLRARRNSFYVFDADWIRFETSGPCVASSARPRERRRHGDRSAPAIE